MGLVTGSLTADLSKFHLKDDAELAVMVIDEKGKWPPIYDGHEGGELSQQEEKRKNSQLEILSTCMAMKCKVILVEMLPTFKTADYIYDHLQSYPKEIFIKDRYCAISASTKPSLADFITQNKITSLVVMGGYKNSCVDATVTGGEDFLGPDYHYSGLEAMGVVVLSSPALLSPYLPKFNIATPFKADAISRDTQDRKMCSHDYSWPRMIFNRGVRIYTEV